ncbi:family 16 glycosylhydrolase [Vibrio sp. B1FLJ16]|uniref:family 16 glycosylhydrolase n=1 Tax=Vibrio sp. B1FLJ16 TaxID=2751178 RepID=UPI0015F65970|nr:family 16 glycosylhydrolase [Vibrio sp. B1FLJ16]CAD7813027.1 Exported glycosyl hydrolase [Vibrio sp. B1FLJ16]CAE6920354.1 Exported glycosyl hydrolase [Vibrio sp. B1FLJ16]
MKKIIKIASIIIIGGALNGCGSQSTVTDINQDTLLKKGNLNKTKTPLYGAEIYSHDKIKFGKFVMRMKMVSSPGVISSFFTYDNKSWQGGIPWREIDIEVVGKQPDQLQTNLITGNSKKRIHSETIHNIQNLDQFHEFTLIWTPDEITWEVDGKVIHTETAATSKQVIDMRDSPQSYRMNLWVSEAVEWAGLFNAQNLPLYQYVDWIEYHSFNNGNFNLEWRDDFNSFNEKRWGKGDWGFDGNLVTFSPNNIAIQDSMLVLGLTNNPKGIN